MVFSWNRCEACIHNDICNRKSQFETLTQKIQNVDKNKPYEGSRVMIECSYYRNNGEPDQFKFAVRTQRGGY